MTNTAAPVLSLSAIAAAVHGDATISTVMHVENIGGGVMALVDYDGLTLTINGGQREAEVSDGMAHLLICRDGAMIGTHGVRTVEEVIEVLAAALDA